MKYVLEKIAERKVRFAGLPLFRRLEGNGLVEHLGAFAHGLTFFAMAFQDVLRLNAARVKDPQLAAIARRHRDEDAGHERWFLHDLRELDAEVEVGSLFGADHQQTRDTSYVLIAEAMDLECDMARIALILSLEATGDALFRRAPAFLERAGYQGRMLYFSRRHHEVESAHDVHDANLASALESVELDPETFEIVSRTVHRTFDAMEAMVNALEARVQHVKPSARVSVRPRKAHLV